MNTHQEAKDRRDNAAYQAVRYLYNGMIPEARAAALEARAVEAEMVRIEAEIDGAA